MYTYKLAAEAWHRLLQLDGGLIDPPPSGASTIQVPTIIHQPNSHFPLHYECAFLLTSLMYLVT
jgi:hypothetical protein